MSMIPIPQETFRSAMKAGKRSHAKTSEDNGATGTALWARSDCVTGEASRLSVGSGSDALIPPAWAPLGIVITSFVLWGCVYRLALVLAAAMGWL